MASLALLTIVLSLIRISISKPTASKSIETSQVYWQPQPPLKWQIISHSDIGDPDLAGIDVYDVDLYSTSHEDVNTLKKNGKKVICYFSAGTWEDWRPDADQFDKAEFGNEVGKGDFTDEGFWPGEYWLNIRSPSVVDRMIARLQVAKDKGCDGVDPDNIDGFNADRLAPREHGLHSLTREYRYKGHSGKDRPSNKNHTTQGGVGTPNPVAGASPTQNNGANPTPVVGRTSTTNSGSQSTSAIVSTSTQGSGSPSTSAIGSSSTQDPEPTQDPQATQDPQPFEDPQPNQSSRATTGFSFTQTDAIVFLRELAAEAHQRGLSIGVKNSIPILDQVSSFIDYAVNEQCVANAECAMYEDFLDSNKPVFHVEYASTDDLSNVSEDEIRNSCASEGVSMISPIIKTHALDSQSIFCD